MIKIAVIMGKMHSGGKKNLVMEYYRNIDREKIQFDFICDRDSNAIPKEEIETLGGRVFEVEPYQNIVKNMYDINRIMRNNQYNIVHGYNGTMNVFAMFIGFINRVPIRINESISMSHRTDHKNILKIILKPFSRCFSTHYMANGVECGIWQFGKRLYDAGKVKIFKTVIDSDKNSFDLDVRRKVRDEYKISDNIVFGHIGRLTIQKNTLFLIDIFNEIYKLEPKAKLLIIGDGELKDDMLSKIEEYNLSDNVVYLGRREDIQQFYNAMDCFLLPSLYEGLPVVGVEAENCGLPVMFSSEIPKESSPCTDLGVFIDLNTSDKKWAEVALEKTKLNIQVRRSHKEEIKNAGFDSKLQGEKMGEYYWGLLNK